MTRSELLSKLQVLGMGHEAERQLKALLQCEVANEKATTPRRQRQQQYRWQIVSQSCLGCGLYWMQVAIQFGYIR